MSSLIGKLRTNIIRPLDGNETMQQCAREDASTYQQAHHLRARRGPPVTERI
jgi:hypothetical protein